MAAPTQRNSARWAVCGAAVALTLMAAAIAIPSVSDLNPSVLSFPPLHAKWQPRVGPGTIPALMLAAIAIAYAGSAASRLPWSRLLVATFGFGAAWMVSLATVDGLAGIGEILDSDYEYLVTARTVTDISATLHEFVERIPYSHPDNWQVHIAGHPPGALLFFVLLVSIGLGSGLAAGFVVLLLGATTPVAVLVTLRVLGGESVARSVAPFLVFGPAAIWVAVSGDGFFAAVAAWGLCCLAMAATREARWPAAGWAVAAGLLLGYCVMLSYGLPLLAFLAIAVLVAARNFRPLPWAAVAALFVVLVFAAAGFAWWEAYPVLRERYWDGVASRRPTAYWIWGNIAALSFSAGPVLGASIAAVAHRAWTDRKVLGIGRRLGPSERHVSAPVQPSASARPLPVGSSNPVSSATAELDLADTGYGGMAAPSGGFRGRVLISARPDPAASAAATRTAMLVMLGALLCVLAADLSGMSKAEVERIWLPFVPWLLVGCGLLDSRMRQAGLVLNIGCALVVQHLLFTGW
ncbi:MAG: hypothetical protein ACR2GB_05285 [Nocardioidaceae bacterium]